MCRFMKISRSSYYECLTSPESNRTKVDQELMLLVKKFFNEGRGNYGSRSIKARMKQNGYNISRRRIKKQKGILFTKICVIFTFIPPIILPS